MPCLGSAVLQGQRGGTLSTLQVSVSPFVQWECGLGDTDKYCDTAIFWFGSLGFGEAQTGNRGFGLVVPHCRGLRKFREKPLGQVDVRRCPAWQGELVGG